MNEAKLYTGGEAPWMARRGNGVQLYQLVRVDDEVREQTLEITFLDPGAEAYVFTFG